MHSDAHLKEIEVLVLPYIRGCAGGLSLEKLRLMNFCLRTEDSGTCQQLADTRGSNFAAQLQTCARASGKCHLSFSVDDTMSTKVARSKVL
jgi:hypothetical protein